LHKKGRQEVGVEVKKVVKQPKKGNQGAALVTGWGEARGEKKVDGGEKRKKEENQKSNGKKDLTSTARCS